MHFVPVQEIRIKNTADVTNIGSDTECALERGKAVSLWDWPGSERERDRVEVKKGGIIDWDKKQAIKINRWDGK